MQVHKASQSPTAKYAAPAARPDSECIAPLNIRSGSRSFGRKLRSELAPTNAAASGPSRTTAASVAAELGDHFVCRALSEVSTESHTRNRTTSVTKANSPLRSGSGA